MANSRLNWTGLKKNLDLSLEAKRQAINPGISEIPVYRQCELLGLNRSSYYYRPCRDTRYNEYLMRLIDEQYTRTPFFGSPQMTRWLKRQKGEPVNHKRVERLMRQMGLMALSPGPHTSRRNPRHKVYPYLLNGIVIDRPDQVWATDITYIRMQRGFLYLVAIMDLYSRYILSWRLSNTLDTHFCLEALEMALGISTPVIFNADQGVQFTSDAFTNRLESEGIAISMAGRGRCFDNILVERLWRTLKYEEIHLHDYNGGHEAEQGIARYIHFYHLERPHGSLGGNTPEQEYYGAA